MLYVPCALTPAATEISLYGLEMAANLARAAMPDDEWAMASPRSAQCVSRHQAREVLLDLRDKLQQPQTYVPTTYHWLLLYECLSFHIECLNDDPGPHVVAALKASHVTQDAASLSRYSQTISRGKSMCMCPVGSRRLMARTRSMGLA